MSDPRLDPRINAMLGQMQLGESSDVKDRDELIARMNSETARQGTESLRQMMEICDSEEIAPSKGLSVETRELTSTPDGNTIKLQLIRHVDAETRPGVYYIHGGGMMTMSCFDGNYRAWGKIIAAQGVNVAMVDFRNCIVPSSAPEVEPFPAGLNDCVSGLKWIHANANTLGIDTSQVIVAGAESASHALATP